MRYLRMVLLFLIVFIFATPVLAEEAKTSYSADFEKFASGQSVGLDDEWNDVVGKVSGGKARTMSPVFGTTAGFSNGSRISRSSNMARMRRRNHSSSNWSGSVSSSGFIHKGMTGQFMPNVTRDRSGPSRGMGMPQSPAKARLKGTWGKSFNASEFTRSGRIGSRAALRKSPRMGTRRSSTSSGTRTGKSSFGRAGTSRARRRR